MARGVKGLGRKRGKGDYYIFYRITIDCKKSFAAKLLAPDICNHITSTSFVSKVNVF